MFLPSPNFTNYYLLIMKVTYSERANLGVAVTFVIWSKITFESYLWLSKIPSLRGIGSSITRFMKILLLYQVTHDCQFYVHSVSKCGGRMWKKSYGKIAFSDGAIFHTMIMSGNIFIQRGMPRGVSAEFVLTWIRSTENMLMPIDSSRIVMVEYLAQDFCGAVWDRPWQRKGPPQKLNQEPWVGFLILFLLPENSCMNVFSSNLLHIVSTEYATSIGISRIVWNITSGRAHPRVDP